MSPSKDKSTSSHSDSDSETGNDASAAGDDAGLFRKEAVREYSRSHDSGGDLIRISPRWVHFAYWFVSVSVVIAFVFGVFAKQNEYATGPAIVVLSGQIEVTTRNSGTVESVDVIPGARVAEGQVLVRFHAAGERDVLDNLQSEFDFELIRLLRDPEEKSARASLARIRAEMGLAKARVEERVLRAPQAGFVHDLRIRPGQFLAAGDPILSIVSHDRSHELVAFLPGQYTPLLETGQRLRLEIAGYSHAYVDLTVEGVGDEVIGPAEARRYLGPEVSDAMPISGSVILVRAQLPMRTFTSGGREHLYFSGMQGLAEVSVREESLLIALLPGLRSLMERIRG